MFGQEVKIVNMDNGTAVFFNAHSFRTARYWAAKYVERNKDKFPMQVWVKDVDGSWVKQGPSSERWY